MVQKGRWILNWVVVAGVTAGWVGWRSLPPHSIPNEVPFIQGVNKYGDVNSMRLEVASELQKRSLEKIIQEMGVFAENIHESPDGQWLAFYKKRDVLENIWELYVMEKARAQPLLISSVCSLGVNPGLPRWRGREVYYGVGGKNSSKLCYFSIDSGKYREEFISSLDFALLPFSGSLAVVAACILASRLSRKSSRLQYFLRREGWGYVASAACLVGQEFALQRMEALAGMPFKDPVGLSAAGMMLLTTNFVALTANDLSRLFKPPFLTNLSRFVSGVIHPERRSETQYALFYGSEWKSMDEALVKQDVNSALLWVPRVLARLERDKGEVGFIGSCAPAIGKSLYGFFTRNLSECGKSLFSAFDFVLRGNVNGVMKSLDDFVGAVSSENGPAARIAAGYVLDNVWRVTDMSDKDRIVCEQKARGFYEAGVRALLECEQFGALPFKRSGRSEVSEGVRNEYLRATIIAKRVRAIEAGHLIMEHHILAEYHRNLPGLVPRPLAYLPRKDGKAYLFELRKGFETLHEILPAKTKAEQIMLLKYGVHQLALLHSKSPWILIENAAKDNPGFYTQMLLSKSSPISDVFGHAKEGLRRMAAGASDMERALRGLPIAYYKDSSHWNFVMNSTPLHDTPLFFPVDFEIREESGVMPVVLDLATFLCFDRSRLELEEEKELCEIYRQELPSCAGMARSAFWDAFCLGVAYRLPAMAGYRIAEYGVTGDISKKEVGVWHLRNSLAHALLLPDALKVKEYIAGLELILNNL